MPKKAKEEHSCPVCGEPVDKDPHVECLEQIKAQQQAAYEAGTGNPPLEDMPCPACGKPLTADHVCLED